jgi:hypothetical protein
MDQDTSGRLGFGIGRLDTSNLTSLCSEAPGLREMKESKNASSLDLPVSGSLYPASKMVITFRVAPVKENRSPQNVMTSGSHALEPMVLCVRYSQSRSHPLLALVW